MYILDAGVGFAFAHVGELGLLAAHYGRRLVYTEAVALEWSIRAKRKLVAGVAGEEDVEAARKRAQDNALRAAGIALTEQAAALLGNPVVTARSATQRLESLRTELLEIQTTFGVATTTAGIGTRPGGGGHGSQHWGECESVAHGEQLLATGTDVVILCANDKGARTLAFNHGIAERTMVSVLTEMVRSESVDLDQERADALLARMLEVTRVPSREIPARLHTQDHDRPRPDPPPGAAT